MSRHTARSALKGLGLGVLAGGAAGAAAAGISMSDCTGEMCGLAILAIPFGAVAGGVTGRLVGAVRTSDEWDIVWRSESVGS